MPHTSAGPPATSAPRARHRRRQRRRPSTGPGLDEHSVAACASVPQRLWVRATLVRLDLSGTPTHTLFMSAGMHHPRQRTGGCDSQTHAAESSGWAVLVRRPPSLPG